MAEQQPNDRRERFREDVARMVAAGEQRDAARRTARKGGAKTAKKAAKTAKKAAK